jgi:hypothetical protein
MEYQGKGSADPSAGSAIAGGILLGGGAVLAWLAASGFREADRCREASTVRGPPGGTDSPPESGPYDCELLRRQAATERDAPKRFELVRRIQSVCPRSPPASRPAPAPPAPALPPGPDAVQQAPEASAYHG